jgi:hypothetical protein
MPELLKTLDIATDDELWGELRDRHPGRAGEEVLRIQFDPASQKGQSWGTRKSKSNNGYATDAVRGSTASQV